MPTPSAAVLDALCSLLDAERGSIFRLTGAGSPFLRDTSAEIRQLLERMCESSHRHEREIADEVRHLGGEPKGRSSARPEQPYLEFLSQRFLIPKLVVEKELLIRFYENALRAVGQQNEHVRQILQRQLGEQREDLHALQHAGGSDGAATASTRSQTP